MVSEIRFYCNCYYKIEYLIEKMFDCMKQFHTCFLKVQEIRMLWCLLPFGLQLFVAARHKDVKNSEQALFMIEVIFSSKLISVHHKRKIFQLPNKVCRASAVFKEVELRHWTSRRRKSETTNKRIAFTARWLVKVVFSNRLASEASERDG